MKINTLFLNGLFLFLSLSAMEPKQSEDTYAKVVLMPNLEEAYAKVAVQKLKHFVAGMNTELDQIRSFPFGHNKSITLDLKKEKSKRVWYKLFSDEDYAPILEHLLKERKIDPNQIVEHEFGVGFIGHYTLLSFTLKNRAVQNALLLLDFGAQPDAVSSDPADVITDGLPLSMAVRQNMPAVVARLLEKKAAIYEGQKLHLWPLKIAADQYFNSSFDDDSRRNIYSITELLLNHGADPVKPFPDKSLVIPVHNGKQVYNVLELVRAYNNNSERFYWHYESLLAKHVKHQ